jgi:hypothetical protein
MRERERRKRDIEREDDHDSRQTDQDEVRNILEHTIGRWS